MDTRHIIVPRTAHYCTLGEAGAQVRYFWIACHGYGQLAKDFIQAFEHIAAEDTFILAPEGLSRFYWGGFSGKPVASWMTSEDRLDEIADFCNYLSLLYNQYLHRLSPEVKVILFGFSQGCATQLRWIMRAFPRFHHLALWAGSVPEDLDYHARLDYFADKDLHYIYGTKDQFLGPARMAEQRQLIFRSGLQFQEHTFDGKHLIEREALQHLASLFRQQYDGSHP